MGAREHTFHGLPLQTHSSFFFFFWKLHQWRRHRLVFFFGSYLPMKLLDFWDDVGCIRLLPDQTNCCHLFIIDQSSFFLLALSGPEDLVGKLPDDVGKSWRPMIQREAGSQPSSGGAPSPSSVSSCPPVPTYSYSAPRRRRFVSYFISIRPSWVISEETATSSSQIIYPTLLPGSRGHLYRHHLKRLTFKDAGLSFF